MSRGSRERAETRYIDVPVYGMAFVAPKSSGSRAKVVVARMTRVLDTTCRKFKRKHLHKYDAPKHMRSRYVGSV